jgi:hypothetical protein
MEIVKYRVWQTISRGQTTVLFWRKKERRSEDKNILVTT